MLFPKLLSNSQGLNCFGCLTPRGTPTIFWETYTIQLPNNVRVLMCFQLLQQSYLPYCTHWHAFLRILNTNCLHGNKLPIILQVSGFVNRSICAIPDNTDFFIVVVSWFTSCVAGHSFLAVSHNVPHISATLESTDYMLVFKPPQTLSIIKQDIKIYT